MRDAGVDWVGRTRLVRPECPPYVAELLDLADLALIAVAAVVTKVVYVDLLVRDFRATQDFALAGLLCATFAGSIFRGASCRLQSPTVAYGSQALRLLLCLALAFLLTIAFAYFMKASDEFSRVWVLMWFVLAYGLLLLSRTGYLRLLQYWNRTGALQPRVAVVGTGAAAERLLRSLHIEGRTSGDGLFTPPWEQRRLAGRPFETLLELGRTGAYDDVVVVDDGSPGVVSAINRLSALPWSIHVASDRFTFDLPAKEVVSYGSARLIRIAGRPIGPWGLLVKRAIDVVVCLIAMPFVLPVFLLIAAAIKLDTAGPVFFRQRRHGMNNRVFHVWKFRTMRVAEDGPIVRQAVAGDDRVTRVGRFLRRTSLDELPQLINVLRGEMTLVGPRPHAIAHDEHYGALLDRYAHRLRVPPGMTGWAQIHGLRGPTEHPRLMAERVRYDLEYIDNWSIWLDLEILLWTPIYGLTHRNAV